MAGNDRPTIRRTAVAVAACTVALVACWLAFGGKPPPLGEDEEVFQAVDALFTAVTACDDDLLGRAEGRLHALREAGRLPADAADYLGGVIATARAGRWQPAAERLYDFMRAQRREARRDGPPP
jgi:hypothetical protein